MTYLRQVVEQAGYIVGHLARLGLIREVEALGGVVLRVPNAYPIYDLGYAERLRAVEAGGVQRAGEARRAAKQEEAERGRVCAGREHELARAQLATAAREPHDAGLGRPQRRHARL